jgi:hypothetical protein
VRRGEERRQASKRSDLLRCDAMGPDASTWFCVNGWERKEQGDLPWRALRRDETRRDEGEGACAQGCPYTAQTKPQEHWIRIIGGGQLVARQSSPLAFAGAALLSFSLPLLCSAWGADAQNRRAKRHTWATPWARGRGSTRQGGSGVRRPSVPSGPCPWAICQRCGSPTCQRQPQRQQGR